MCWFLYFEYYEPLLHFAQPQKVPTQVANTHMVESHNGSNQDQ